MVTDDFYRALEDRFRGSRDLIKARQKVYLPVVEAILKQVPKKVLDVGCGRAEWLELLAERGFAGTGIDLNDDFVADGRQAGFPVLKGEAIEFLGRQPDQSHGLISAFHLVEHLGFETLLAFLKEAHRVLDNGGAILLETPNPANLLVGACNFYLDPTHERPIPSVLLSFAAEFSGFERVVVVPVNRDFLLNDLELLPSEFSGASVVNKVVAALDQNFMQAPDYAVIAFKKSNNEAIAAAESLVELSTLPISHKETEDMNALFARVLDAETERVTLRAKVEQAAAEAALLKDRAVRSEERLRELRSRSAADQAESAARARQLEAQLRLEQARAVAAEDLSSRAQQQVTAMLASSSWRLSSPVRAGGTMIKSVGQSRALATRLFRRSLLHAAAYIQSRPVVKQRIANVLSRMPGVRAMLIRVAGFDAARNVVTGAPMPEVESVDRLTERGRRAYDQLSRALNAHTQK